MNLEVDRLNPYRFFPFLSLPDPSQAARADIGLAAFCFLETDMPARKQPLFDLGQVMATPGALHLLEIHQQFPIRLLARHQQGDWGDLGTADQQANDAAVIAGQRLLSAYVVGDGRIWIITEADRSSTTLLLPSEY